MIAQLSGRMWWWGPQEVLIDVGGVGYLLSLSKRAHELLRSHADGDTVTLPVALVVREDAMELFGFADQEERAMFLLLLSVPGVGPKSARNILALADPRTLQRAVAEEDIKVLTRVSGIGRKLAQKIILELRSKLLTLSEDAAVQGASAPPHDDVVAALRALGYSRKEAQEAVAAIKDMAQDAEFSERLRAALRFLGNPR